MTITLETELVRQCAPTLAGLKAANLFLFPVCLQRDPFCPGGNHLGNPWNLGGHPQVKS